jgi:DNA repair exonuclease SbcCD ATPase subunit
MQTSTPSIDPVLDEKAKALRAQHRLRLQQLRAQERLVANAKAEAFRSAQKASEAKSLEARAAAWEEGRADAVRAITHQLDSAMSTLGAGHTDAQLFVMQRQRQRLEQEARQAVQAQRQAQRAAAALQRVRQEANQQAARVENHRARRDALLAAAREQASQFRAAQVERAELQQDASAVIAQLEHERRRHQLHSLVDFKHSRLHEQLTPVPHAVLSDKVAQMPHVPDPVQAAKETAER